MAERRTAVIDLGSNSFRLVVFTAAERWWNRTDEIYLPVRIGEGLDASGELGAKPMQRALEAVEVFAHFCAATAIGLDDVRAVATSAIRDAANQRVFLDRVREQSGMHVRVLSREEEAMFGYLAAVNSTTLDDGAALDLGGGSLQLVEVSSRHPGRRGSWPVGSVRMTEHFFADDDPPPKKARKKLRAHLADMLEREAPWLPDSGPRIVGIGGTLRNLAAAAQAAAGEPSIGVQGYAIERDALGELIDRFASMKAADRGSVKGIKAGRADVILAGALVVDCVLEHGGFDAIEVTEAGLREGVFFDEHLAGDPPLFDDVRGASVRNLAARYEVGPRKHPDHVARLALNLFDELAAHGLHDADRWERELLRYASLLHDIGMSVDYDDHHKHSRYLILNAGLPGFAPREVALIAQAARYHRKGMPEFGELSPLASDGDDDRLDRLAILLRLAEDLERSRDQSVKAAHVAAADGEVRLELEADGSAAVERWAAQGEVDLFDRAFGRKLQVAPA